MAIQLLPGELLSEIFSLSRPPYPERMHFKCRCTGLLQKAAPRVFLEVCTSWRAVALSTPRLWSEFTIDVNRFTNFVPLYAQIESWLNRSGNAPLSIRLAMDPFVGGFNGIGDRTSSRQLEHSEYSDNFSRILNLFVGHIHHWRIVELGLPTNGNVFKRTAIPIGGARILKTLRVEFLADVDAAGGNIGDYHFERLLVSPKLERFEGLEYSLFRLQLSGPEWNQARFTKIVLGECYLFTILEVLNCAPSLQSLNSDLASASFVGTYPYRTNIVHPNLKELILRTRRSGDLTVVTILDNVTLPSLESLNLSTGGAYQIYRSLSALFARSSCPLHDLLLFFDGSEAGPQSVIIDCIRRVTATLEMILMVRGISVGDEFFSVLTVPFSAQMELPHLLPNLLYVSLANHEFEDSDLLTDMVASRQALSLVHCDPDDPSMFSFEHQDGPDCWEYGCCGNVLDYLSPLGVDHPLRARVERLFEVVDIRQ